MTREDMQKVLAVIDNVYVNWHPKDAKLTLEVWLRLLKDYSAADVGEALRRYMVSDTSGFAPIPSQIINIIHTTQDDTDSNEMEAWAMVRKAIANGSYGAAKEFELLPQTVQKAVGSSDNLREWAMMDIETVESVVQSNFSRNYRNTLRRERELRRLTPVAAGNEIEKKPDAEKNVELLIQKTEKQLASPDMSNDFTRRLYKQFGKMPEKEKA